jgi:hypothetical protein
MLETSYNNELLELAEEISEEDLAKRKAVHETNARHWLKVDFEIFNACLGIELNEEISPLLAKRVIQKRLEQMTEKERNELPSKLWLYLDGLDITKFNDILKFRPKQKPTLHFTLRKRSENEVLITPKTGTLKNLCKEIGDTDKWETWCQVYPDTSVSQENVSLCITSRGFRPWGEADLCEIFLDLIH